jgi:hypothetical protein
MNKQRRLFVFGSALVFSGCATYLPTYPEYFEFKWIEDVQLHDGRVIPVEVTRNFQRLDRRTEYKGPIRMHTSVAFDAGPRVGRFELKVRGNIAMVDQKDGVWYLLVSGHEPPYVSLPPIVMDSLRLVHLEGNRVVGNQHSRELPKEFKDLNLMHLMRHEILAPYHGKHVSLKDKEEYRKKNNTGISDRKIFPTACAKDGTC